MGTGAGMWKEVSLSNDLLLLLCGVSCIGHLVNVRVGMLLTNRLQRWCDGGRGGERAAAVEASEGGEEQAKED